MSSRAMGVDLRAGDVLEVVRGLPDESFTACLCDPPYGLVEPRSVRSFGKALKYGRTDEEKQARRGGFMGKKWDASVPDKRYWAEILRVLKPGAVLMAFGGTRTWHRLAVAIEDAGFEIFDTMMWLYGSGFPKSHNIGKAIDKAAGAEREVVGKHESPAKSIYGSELPKDVPITVPATDAAKVWEGYGTALKPAWEPILLARKPRRATYAQTAVEHGTGALWIDGCRVGTDWSEYPESWKRSGHGKTGGANSMFGITGAGIKTDKGRWPANLLLSHSDCERVGVKRVKGTGGHIRRKPSPSSHFGSGSDDTVIGHDEAPFRDPDGLETVAAYRCSPDCPVAMLDRQSGVSTEGKGRVGGGDGKAKGLFGIGSINQSRYPGTGGASRFFQTFEGEREETVEEWKCAEDCPVAMLDRQSGVLKSGARKGGDQYHLGRFEGQKGARGLKVGGTCEASVGGASRFFQTFDGERFYYCAKASRKERDMGLEGMPEKPRFSGGLQGASIPLKGSPMPVGRNSHPTVKPLALCEYLARLIVPPEEYRDEAKLLVPFCGSGSEIIGALMAGWRNVVGIDIIPEYLEIARLRIGALQLQPMLEVV